MSLSILTRAGKALPTATPGTAGNDFIRGSAADEVVNGRGGNDTIFGGGGDDRLDGGAGDDVLRADWRDDDASGIRARLAGGTGTDTFEFLGVSRVNDTPIRDIATILDFDPRTETIDLSEMWVEDRAGLLERLDETDVTVRQIDNSRYQIEGLDGDANANDTILVFTSQPSSVAEIEAALIFG